MLAFSEDNEFADNEFAKKQFSRFVLFFFFFFFVFFVFLFFFLFHSKIKIKKLDNCVEQIWPRLWQVLIMLSKLKFTTQR